MKSCHRADANHVFLCIDLHRGVRMQRGIIEFQELSPKDTTPDLSPSRRIDQHKT